MHVEVGTDEMTISGEYETRSVEDDGPVHPRSERNPGKFYRSIPLVDGADAEHCAAHFKNGLLEVEFQGPADAKPKTTIIPID